MKLLADATHERPFMAPVLCPLTMNLYYACGAWGDPTVADKRPRPVTDATPRFRRIHLSHITARQVKVAAAFLYGLAEMPVEDISLSDVSISMAPDAEAGYAEMADDLELMQRAGILAHNARRLGPAMALADSADIEISASTTRTPVDGAPVVLMRNVDGAFVQVARQRREPACSYRSKANAPQGSCSPAMICREPGSHSRRPPRFVRMPYCVDEFTRNIR